MNFKGKYGVIHVLQCLAGMDERMTTPASEELSTFVAPLSSST